MPELRRDPVVGRWVIISTERAKRPDHFAMGNAVEKEALAPGEKCPFCEGNESLTPPEIYASRKHGTRANGPGWDIRVVPSISPLLQIEGNLDRHGHGMYDLINARGAHEIVVESPNHVTEAELSKEQVVKSYNVILDRIQDLEKDKEIKYVLIFKNYGAAAGGGHIQHARTQIIGTPVNLKRVKEELAGSKAYYDYKDRCIFCDMLKQELSSGERVMAESKHFVALAAFAARFPFETWIMPKEHSCDFYKVDRARIADFAELMILLFAKMRKVIGDFPFNFVLHTAPFRRNVTSRGYWETIESDYHWHFEILPILTRVAGFEWGSGFYINPLPPEDACKAVKEAKV
ncbi:MAG: galactose-1-phosphate uridylyltransferase [Candidatus Omnitrophica bacterium]|nr:galactose-1-phosphate uridylyltransferase [Candidatus Omnitrophota bacterium]